MKASQWDRQGFLIMIRFLIKQHAPHIHRRDHTRQGSNPEQLQSRLRVIELALEGEGTEL